MVVLKDATVKVEGLVPEMFYALGVAAALKHRMFDLNTVITSALDGEHNPGSLHPLGRAIDLRTNDIKPQDAISWFESIKSQLYLLPFDVVWEGGVGATPATTGAHIHIECDPHGRTFWHVLGDK